MSTRLESLSCNGKLLEALFSEWVAIKTSILYSMIFETVTERSWNCTRSVPRRNRPSKHLIGIRQCVRRERIDEINSTTVHFVS